MINEREENSVQLREREIVEMLLAAVLGDRKQTWPLGQNETYIITLDTGYTVGGRNSFTSSLLPCDQSCHNGRQMSARA